MIRAPIVIDGISGNTLITRQQISAQALPDVARKGGINEAVRLYQGIGELEEIARTASARDEAVRLGLPGSAELASLMTYELGDELQVINRVYWNVSPSTIFGILDQVRTTLVELVAQIRAETGTVSDPSTDALQNAVNVAIHGNKSHVTVNAAQTTAGGDAKVITESLSEKLPPWWRTTKAFWAFLVGLAGIAGAVFAYLQFIR